MQPMASFSRNLQHGVALGSAACEIRDSIGPVAECAHTYSTVIVTALPRSKLPEKKQVPTCLHTAMRTALQAMHDGEAAHGDTTVEAGANRLWNLLQRQTCRLVQQIRYVISLGA